jgi:hypothetical protein
MFRWYFVLAVIFTFFTTDTDTLWTMTAAPVVTPSNSAEAFAESNPWLTKIQAGEALTLEEWDYFTQQKVRYRQTTPQNVRFTRAPRTRVLALPLECSTLVPSPLTLAIAG